MATVMSWSSGKGELGRCDDKCHSAALPKCRCMCGGVYHGSKRDGTFDRINREQGRTLMDKLAGEGLIHPTQGMLL